MKVWKRNAIVATVLVLICAGVYLNWDSGSKAVADLTDTLNGDILLEDTSEVMSQSGELMETSGTAYSELSSDYFAQIRLNRQQSRDSAVELLQETISFDEEGEGAVAAVASLDSIVSNSLEEAEIESLIIAKGYQDCVAYMGEESINIAVTSPETGLTDSDIALISDIVTTQSDYDISEIRIIEVK